MPKRRFSATSRPATFPSVAHYIQPEHRTAPQFRERQVDVDSAASGQIRPKIRVARNKAGEAWSLGGLIDNSPVDPRPKATEDGPCSTSTFWVLNGSR